MKEEVKKAVEETKAVLESDDAEEIKSKVSALQVRVPLSPISEDVGASLVVPVSTLSSCRRYLATSG